MGKMHAGKMTSSKRLTKVYEFLRSRGDSGATTFEIIKACRVAAVNSIISELRRNGFVIETKDEGFSEDHSHVYRYVLRVESQLELFGRDA